MKNLQPPEVVIIMANLQMQKPTTAARKVRFDNKR
jgi:hypothetical protein